MRTLVRWLLGGWLRIDWSGLNREPADPTDCWGE